ERRVFYIDVGNMPAHMAMGYVNRVKNEIHQRRIPSQSGGANTMDATYNPLSINEDYFFPQTAEGRGSKVDTLPGGTGLGEIDDLKYFTNKLFRGLRIPSSYLPTGADDGAASNTDGRVGTALIQEYRFNQYCKRLQNTVASTFDFEFKMFLNWKGYNIDSSMFELRMNEPQNFAAYRQAEIDASRASLFTSLANTDYLSKRFLLKRFLGLSEEEIADNDRMWSEENGEATLGSSSSQELRSVGITPGDINTDFDSLDGGEEGGDADIDLDLDLDTGDEPSIDTEV
ncbi:MAG: portal protein, partial [Methylophagaceae bacterium]